MCSLTAPARATLRFKRARSWRSSTPRGNSLRRRSRPSASIWSRASPTPFSARTGLPPQKVETVFLYSWALSYLAGNANIVRLPQAISTRMRAIVDLFLERLEAAGDESQLFVHYPSQGDLGG